MLASGGGGSGANAGQTQNPKMRKRNGDVHLTRGGHHTKSITVAVQQISIWLYSTGSRRDKRVSSNDELVTAVSSALRRRCVLTGQQAAELVLTWPM